MLPRGATMKAPYCLLLLSQLLATGSTANVGYAIECTGELTTDFKLPDNLVKIFLGDYKVNVHHRVWTNNAQDGRIEELAAGGAVGILHRSTNQSQHWIFERNSTENSTGVVPLFHDETSNSCSAFNVSSPPPQRPFSLPDNSAKLFQPQGISVAGLVLALAHFNWTATNLSSVAVAGVEGVRWIGCANFSITNSSVRGVQVEFVYTGDHQLQPFDSGANRPVVLSVDVAEWERQISPPTDAPINISWHSSFSFDYRLGEVLQERDRLLATPPDVPCTGLNTSALPIQDLPENALFEFVVTDEAGNETSVELFFSRPHNTSAVLGTPESGKLAFLSSAAPLHFSDANQRAVLIHDFEYGLETVLDPTEQVGCVMQTLPTSSQDVKVTNGTLELVSATQLALGGRDKGGGWTKMNNVSDKAIYVAKNVAVWLGENGTLDRVVEFNGTKSTTYRLISTLVLPSSAAPPRWMAERDDCFVPASKNGSFTFDIKDASLHLLTERGERRVSDLIAAQIAAKCQVQPARIRLYYTDKPPNLLSVFFTLASQAGATPANTTNRKPELSTDEAYRTLANWTATHDWAFTIFDPDSGHKLRLQVVPGSLAIFEGLVPPPTPSPTPKPPYQGYTPGAMAVMGIFMLLLGALGAVGLMVVLQRRGRISELAYHVFE